MKKKAKMRKKTQHGASLLQEQRSQTTQTEHNRQDSEDA